ncbi:MULTISPECIES: putative bifunctional diguanylate cyclase/phosphodiesterase [unclassified Nitrosospira]|uniref:putative bifunctional diguanylate cyclase/phosphodiesterase n=1 Tax=unclassified Nitrosospira TaxID=2609267 RepID=UPI000D3F1CFF|nr:MULTISPECIES: EAL domain-containing protein [unclassified Nitrosospira]PTR16451.1 diguanylate cyclase/phosphodiesterase with PAS/PAC sensor(s) [Nitrosospira sp. Nsp2]WON73566.1 EAL domain-containing protein [Nitrosospira sp. Is2]
MKHKPRLPPVTRSYQKRTNQGEPPTVETADQEEALLYSTALQTSRAILEAREQTEHELNQAKKALEEKTAELDRSVAMLRATIESTADGLLVTDKHGKVLCYNQLYVDMWPIPGPLMDNGRHQPIIEYCSAQLTDPQQFVRLTGHIYVMWPPESFDVLQFNDGRVFERYTKVKFAEGRNVGRVWSFSDITERRRAEAYTAQLAAIVESSNDAIVVSDLNGTITSWNTGAEKIFGYQASEIIGSSICRLMPPDGLEEEDNIMNLKSGKAIGHFETVRLRKDNKPIDVSVTISPVRDGSGRIAGASSVLRDISQRKESQARIEYLAHYDSLTELPNRALLADRMKIAIGNAARYSTRLALLFLDLDRFKLVNDSLGHEIGDKLLKVVAERMRSTIRNTDTISRVGGDEFVVLLSPIEKEEDAARVAKKLIAVVAHPYLIDEHELILTASVGISLYPDNGKEAGSLLRNADASMYSAKEAGRNSYQFYTDHLNSRAAERLSLDRDLRVAIERDETFTVFQPQIELTNRQVIGAEALVRWRHPRRGLVSPASFIPVAEDSGLILSLGERILREACIQARRWHDDGVFNRFSIAVNVSAVQFRQKDFTDVVLRVVSETGLSPTQLELEVTESVVMQNVESVVQKMRILKDHGIKIAIDDFGTGYSSLSYLRQLTVDRLKIDQSFIRDLPANDDAKAIVRAIAAMGRSLGLSVTAEGVETEVQEKFLQSIECDEGQGYLYAKPMVPTDFEAWLKTWNSSLLQ